MMITFLSALLAGWAAAEAPATCSYSTWEWNVRSRRAENRREVRKLYSELDPEEKDAASGCTVCSEDQVTIRVPGMPEFQVCRALEQKIAAAISELAAAGWPVSTLVGYRVGRSKGPLDAKSLRTRFSWHSYGTAVDLNSERNGLYDNCVSFGPQCRLVRGGPWDPKRAGTITRDSAAYRAFTSRGLRWGGELIGRQKDFMHFSLTGD